jgi:CPA1 family monovalent cation:H+ antiporter
MKGALSVALVSSLNSTNITNYVKDTIATITFGVVLCSLIIQYIGLAKYVQRVFPGEQTSTEKH